MKKYLLSLGLMTSSMIYAKPSIEIGLILDSSGSMGGLINQTRERMWQLMIHLEEATKDGQTPDLRIGLLQYGQDSLGGDYLKVVKDLTTDHDGLSQELNSLKANGSIEYAGKVVQKAVEGLAWQASAEDFKAIFLAGNETLKQGSVTIEEAADLTKQNDIFLNLIYASQSFGGSSIPAPHPRAPFGFPASSSPPAPAEDPVHLEWKTASEYAGGSFAMIKRDNDFLFIKSPYDALIKKLNDQLNKTYIPYGALGQTSYTRMIDLDNNSTGHSIIWRGRYKTGVYYNTGAWDLVDASKEKDFVWNKVKATDLPKDIRDLPLEALKKYVADKEKQREFIKKQVKELYQKRADFVAKERKRLQQEGKGDSIEQAMLKALKEQLSSKGFELKIK